MHAVPTIFRSAQRGLSTSLLGTSMYRLPITKNSQNVVKTTEARTSCSAISRATTCTTKHSIPSFHRGFSTMPGTSPVSAAPVGENSPPQKPKTWGSIVVDYFVDHPWHFFGPLIAFIVGWLVRSNFSTDNQDTLIKAIDDTSPLHAREVAAIGKSNMITIADWKRIVDAALNAAVVKHQQHQQGTRASSSSPLSLSLKPSEIKFIIEEICGRPLQQSHMLARAASGLALVRDGFLVYPIDNDAVDTMQKNEKQASFSTSSAATPPPSSSSNESLNPPWHVYEAKGPSILPGSKYDDPEVNVLQLLSLYGTAIGGRPEFPFPQPQPPQVADSGGSTPIPAAPPVVPSNSPFASPLQRLSLYVDMIRKYQMLASQEKMMSSEEEKEQGRSLNATYSSSSSQTPTTMDTSLYLTSYTYSLHELASVVELLSNTHQIPTRCRAGVQSKWPIKRFMIRDSIDALVEGADEFKLSPGLDEQEKEKARSSSSSSSSSLAAVATNHFSGDASVPAPRRFTPVEARKLVLISRGVCAWGECYGSPA